MSSQLAEHTEKDKEQQVETLKGVKGEKRINSVKQLSRLTSFNRSNLSLRFLVANSSWQHSSRGTDINIDIIKRLKNLF